MKNVIAIVRLMSTPMSWAAWRSCAVERIARPILVRLTNSWRATIRMSAVAMTNRFTQPTLTPRMSTRAFGSMTCGVLIGDGP